jgi:hypothetical protein
MNEILPSTIESYFSGKNARDFAMAASGFSSSAVVKDEGRDHQGPTQSGRGSKQRPRNMTIGPK